MRPNTKKIVLTDKTDIKEYMWMVVINMEFTNTLIIQFADKYLPIFTRIEPMLEAMGWEDVTTDNEMKIRINKVSKDGDKYVLDSNQRILEKIGALRK
ncbi:hypothetical protein KKE60_07630 [Patescibacteria group bacterium]|nr:hypothetical protein [Patescibacteria group bacterium]